MSGGSDEPYLFIRNELEPGELSEDWDDSDLITAYDKTVSAVKQRITRKIQRELGLKDEDIKEFLSDAGSSGSKSKKNRKGQGKKKREKKWEVGSSCRAIYSEDGEEYEAVVIKILDSHWCIVRFVGYENEEEVMIEDLIPSFGKQEVQMQMKAANEEEGELQDSSEGEYIEDINEVPKAQLEQGYSTKKIYRESAGHSKALPKRLPMSFPFPPPPPIPPLMMSKGLITRQHDIDSMLMSWYMCGYYTGLYERGQELHKN